MKLLSEFWMCGILIVTPTVFSADLEEQNVSTTDIINTKHQNNKALSFKWKLTLFNYLHPLNNLTFDDLAEREMQEWHLMPYKRLDYFIRAQQSCEEINQDIVKPRDPDWIFSLEQLRNGAIILHILGVIYFFTLLTVVCNDYFLPAVECICFDLNISEDIAAATFMATATTTPEFFTNTISTFFIESDLGLGTILGSLMFNTLGVAALASLAAPKPVQIDWWPLTRDCFLYTLSLSVLIYVIWDGAIFWNEALALFILYFIYFFIVFNSSKIRVVVKYYVEVKWGLIKQKRYDFINSNRIIEIPPEVNGIESTNKIFIISYNDETTKTKNQIEKKLYLPEIDVNQPKHRKSLWRIPLNITTFKKLWYFYCWPIKFILTCTVPSPKTYRKLYPISFIMCIIWIGINSYIIVSLVVQIGITFDIPESVMGLTLLAAGGCLPEAISAVIMARKGEGRMGVSNSLGANSLAILFSLGIPWFIRTSLEGGWNNCAFVDIQSYGIELVVLSLLFTVVALYLVVSLFGFRLKKTVGLLLFIVYFIILVCSILVEMDVLFPSGNGC